MVHNTLRVALLRSRGGNFEPRFESIATNLKENFGEVHAVLWRRTRNEQILSSLETTYVYKRPAGYGRRWRNLLQQLNFQFFIWKSLNFIQPKIIYACDLDTLVTSIVWSNKRNTLVIYDQFDPFESRFSNYIFKRITSRFEKFFSDSANIRITANSKRISDYELEKWITIPNFFKIQTKAENINKREKQIFYGGTLTEDRGLKTLVEAMSSLPEWTTHIYGDGPVLSSLKKNSPSNVSFHNPISHDKLMEAAKNSYLYFAHYDPLYLHNQNTASNKLFEAVQLKIPLLVADGTHLANIVRENSIGFVSKYADTEDLIRQVRNFDQWKMQNFDLFVQNADLLLLNTQEERGQKQLNKLISELLEQNEVKD
jgi:glycosyltransferase involved in cell wall biosynthesis